MVFQLIYTCALASSVCCDELAKIASTSAVKNAESGITGMLLCKDGSVLQVLEGRQHDVEALYAKIQRDRRVKNLLVLIRRTGDHREFPHWSMGFKNGDEVEAAFGLCAASLPNALPDQPSPEVRTITRTFARVNGLSVA